MKVVPIIPARFQSSRFPGKPLVSIMGKPMIRRVYEAVLETGLFDEVWVATDHRDIFEVVKGFTDSVAMTGSNHFSGTDRIWELAQKMTCDAILCVQGDEPLITASVLSDLVKALERDEVVTAAYFCQDHDWFLSPDHVKVVIDRAGYGLYFSRSPLPFHRDRSFVGFWHHVGLYGYRHESLRRFVTWEKGKLEQIESLEQLRFLENGTQIRVVETQYQGVGVDRKEDVALVEKILLKRGVVPA